VTNALTTLLLTSAVTFSSAFAQSSMPAVDMSKPNGASSTMPGAMSTSSMNTTATLSKLSGKTFDQAFLSMMIPHHQAALEMARAVLPTTKDATVKRWAQGIITSQQAEIGTMTALLKSLGGADPKMTAMMDGMKGMGTMVKAAKNPDIAFVQSMLPHYSSAIDTANVALQKSANPTVLKLAQNIVLAQVKEMYEYRTWILKQ